MGTSIDAYPKRSATARATAPTEPGPATAGGPGPDAPDWVQDAIFYQVFPDRFANGDVGNDPFGVDEWDTKPGNWTFTGGDLDGLREKLPYLQRLGVNALYLNPVFEATSNHKYDTTDYENVDDNFGGNRALKSLVSQAHEGGMRVMLDGVFNHTSHQHEWFQDVRDRGKESPYFDFYNVHSWPIRYRRDDDGVLRSADYDSWWGYATLPELKTTNPEVREYFLRGKDAIVKKWIDEYDIDGWRMDVADEVELDFWREARKQIKAAKPDAYMLAEAWQDASPYLQGDTFDATMNYRYFQQPATEFFAQKEISADDFAQRVQSPYPAEAKYAAFNLLDSHDTPRFITQAGGDWYRMRPAAIFQMTYVGAPVIYYGDEVGMEGGPDPDSRRTFRDDLVPRRDGAPAGGGTPPSLARPAKSGTGISDAERAAELHGLYRTLIRTRRDEDVLRRGKFDMLHTHNEHSTLSYRRWLDGDKRDAIVAINNNVVGKPVDIPVGSFATDGTAYVDALSGRRHIVDQGKLSLGELDGNWGAVLLRDTAEAPATTDK